MTTILPSTEHKTPAHKQRGHLRTLLDVNIQPFRGWIDG
jgi:hypothetical protein